MARRVRGVRGRIGVVRQPVRPHAPGRAHPGLDQLRRCGRLMHRVELSLGQHAAAGRLDRVQDGLGRVLDAAPVAVNRAAGGKYRVGVARDAVLADALRGRVQLRGPVAARGMAAAGAAQAGHRSGAGAAAAPGAEQARAAASTTSSAASVTTPGRLRPAGGGPEAVRVSSWTSLVEPWTVRDLRRRALQRRYATKPRRGRSAAAGLVSVPGRSHRRPRVLCLCHPRRGTMD